MKQTPPQKQQAITTASSFTGKRYTHPLLIDARVLLLTPSVTPEKRSPRLSRADG